MNQLKKKTSIYIILLLLIQGVYAQEVKVKWNFAEDYNAKDKLGLSITLVNLGKQSIDLSKSGLWFNSLYPISDLQQSNYQFHNRNGNLYQVTFNQKSILQAKDSIQLRYQSPYPITHISLIPNGFYFQSINDPAQTIDLGHPEITALQLSTETQHQFLAELYDQNSSFKKAEVQRILPSVSQVTYQQGNLSLTGKINAYIDPIFKSEVPYIQEFTASFKGMQWIQTAKEKALIRVLHTSDLPKEGYKLTISKEGLLIAASSSAGVFYAIQTLRSLLTAEQLNGKQGITLPYLNIQDQPRFEYRGFMMDISRNFKDVQTIKKYLDLMATLKLNKFHLHLIDDEGWRLEIPSLPELTEIGAVRSASFEDGKSIQPAYGSGPKASQGAYLSKEQFKDILVYAAQRHITVIPEVESPGHGRASIKAMETRYNRFMKQGKQKEAEEFLLYEAADQSVYSSAQYWDDNVMNPALPAVYRFIDVVLEEIKQMYQEAGLTLTRISLGGDEVPSGSWEKSPAIKELMKKEGFQTVYEVWPYYIQQIYDICQRKGLEMAGWEEFGMVNKGAGMVVNEELSHLPIQLDVWNNVIGGGQEDLAYRLANAGYKTVFTSCANFYLDMVWDQDFREPGLKWASITDLNQSYSFLPTAFFANMKYTKAGRKLDTNYLNKKVRLTEKGKANLEGIKAAIWAESVLTADRMDYMVLPRLYALAERAWAKEKDWENEDKFDYQLYQNSYAALANKIGIEELPKLNLIGNGFSYRLPSIGLKLTGAKLLANAEIEGFEIRYTLDQSEPSRNSQLFPKDGLQLDKVSAKQIKVSAWDREGRTGRTSTYTLK
ncbi:family 20 glycosylhydrolase [Sphingobacterium sp. HJSM2_6]|uniref:family 20 glycosylhydrolase n=1 Tax=Sphingobacterium sp. HJSM2_6 TaxID=3366264 RepID=UPI003BE77CC1